MPAILGCRSPETFDSLPRQKRGENSAIHRLQSQSSEFGIARGDSVSFAATPSPGGRTSKDIRVRNRTRSTGGALERGISSASSASNAGGRSRHSVDNGSRPFLGKSRSTSSKSVSKPVSSGDYPVVSSDLEYSDGGRQSPVKMRASRSVPGSPTKPHAEATRLGGGRLDEGGRGDPQPARKRVVNKAMIGLPTNFQHTGHIGAANYRAAVTDSAALQAQLSEVAAALKLDFNLGPLDSSNDDAATLSSQSVNAKKSVDTLDSNTPLHPPIIEEAHEEQPASETTVRADSPDVDEVSIRAVPAQTILESPAPSRALPSSPTPSAAVPRSAFAATYGHSAHAPPASISPSTGAKANGLNRAGSSATSGVAAGGARKRKPVPRTLDMAFDAPSAAAVPPAAVPAQAAPPSEADVDLDTPLSAEPSSLDRNVSLVGELPSFGGSSKARGKLTPLERAVGKAAATSSPLAEADEEDEEGGAGEGGGELYTHGPNGTLRLGGKKMVEGPAGTYITDTANVRWNSALKEITMALKDPTDEPAGEEEDMEAAMRRADDVLGRLGQEG